MTHRHAKHCLLLLNHRKFNKPVQCTLRMNTVLLGVLFSVKENDITVCKNSKRE